VDKPTSACVRGQRLSDGDAIRRVPGRALSAPPPCPCRLTPGMGRTYTKPKALPRAALRTVLPANPGGIPARQCARLPGWGRLTFGRTTSEPPNAGPSFRHPWPRAPPSVVILGPVPSICRSPPRHSWSSRKPEGPADLLGTTAEDDDGGAAASRWPWRGRGWRGVPRCRRQGPRRRGTP